MQSANQLSKEKAVQSLNQLQEPEQERDPYFHKTGNNISKVAFRCCNRFFETVVMFFSFKESK